MLASQVPMQRPQMPLPQPNPERMAPGGFPSPSNPVPMNWGIDIPQMAQPQAPGMMQFDQGMMMAAPVTGVERQPLGPIQQQPMGPRSVPTNSFPMSPPLRYAGPGQPYQDQIAGGGSIPPNLASTYRAGEAQSPPSMSLPQQDWNPWQMLQGPMAGLRQPIPFGVPRMG